MSRDLTTARAACARGLAGWERLLTTRDRAERALVRAMLEQSCRDHDQRRAEFLQAIERAVQSGTARAFG